MNQTNEIFLKRNFNSTINLVNKLGVLSDNEIAKILYALEFSSNVRVRNAIALKVVKCKETNKVDISPLVRKVMKLRHSNYTDTLIYACSEFDCTEFIKPFVSLFIHLDNKCLMETEMVFREMKGPIIADTQKKILEKLIKHRDGLSRNHVKNNFLNLVISYIHHMPIMHKLK